MAEQKVPKDFCGCGCNPLEQKGKSVSFADLQIGVIAMANDLILISGNIKYFKGIPGFSVKTWRN